MGQVGEWPDELIPLDAHPNPSDRYAAASWARQLLIRRDWVVVDTETTGLANSDQVLQVAVLDPSGRVLVDTTVRPTCEIHPRASEVHGFTIESLGSAPTYDQVHDAIASHLAGRRVIAYNSPFDQRLLAQSAVAWGLPPVESLWECAMRRYAQYVGSRRRPGSEYTWHKLPRGAESDAIHGARDDCLLTLKLIRHMARPLVSSS